MKIRKFKYFYPEKPQLIHRDQPLVDEISNDPNWIAEPKYNGTRCQLHVINGDVQFWGRHGEPLRYNKLDSQGADELVKQIKQLIPSTGYYLFDSELRHNKVVGVYDKIVIYDVFIYDNELLIKEPFWSRRARLEGLFDVDDTLLCSLIKQYKNGDFRTIFEEITVEPEMEGLVLKNLQGKLNLARNRCIDSSWMFKIRIETGRHKF